MPDQHIVVIQTISIKQLQCIVAVLLKCKHVLVQCPAVVTLALAVSEHVTCDHPEPLGQQVCDLTLELSVRAPCTVVEEQGGFVVVIWTSENNTCQSDAGE